MTQAASLDHTAHLSDDELDAWRRFLRAHAAITRQLDADLIASHHLTLRDYEVLLHLAQAPHRRLRMSDLAERVLLTRSGVTRLVDGLVRSGWVERVSCPSDARGSFAAVTDAGYDKLRQASVTHLEGVRSLYVDRFSGEELGTLSALLATLPGAERGGASCAVDAQPSDDACSVE
jgi:DNA-binding MarR family transcriptional regulator